MSGDGEGPRRNSLSKLATVVLLAVCAPAIWFLALAWIEAVDEAERQSGVSWTREVLLPVGGALLLILGFFLLLRAGAGLVHAAFGGTRQVTALGRAADGTMARRAILRALPGVAVIILAGGFALYAIACAPVISRRGYPEIDPFVLSFAWLWAFPIALSAPFDRLSRCRIWSLLLYGLATAVIMGGCGDYAVPRHVRPIDMISFGLLFWAPIHLAIAAAVETASRLILRRVRAFAEPGVRVINESTETVTEADPSGGLLVIPSPRRIGVYLIVVALLAAGFPFAFRAASLAHARWVGRDWAERDWDSGDAYLFVRYDERDVSVSVQETYDAATGLKLYQIYGGVAKQVTFEAYREAIDKRLAEFGPLPIVKHLLTVEEVESLIAAGKLGTVAGSLLREGRLVIRTTWPDEFVGTCGNGPPGLAGDATVPEKGDVQVLLNEWGIVTYHPDGRRLQYFHVFVGRGAREAAKPD